jgi:hypothetical protein
LTFWSHTNIRAVGDVKSFARILGDIRRRGFRSGFPIAFQSVQGFQDGISAKPSRDQFEDVQVVGQALLFASAGIHLVGRLSS